MSELNAPQGSTLSLKDRDAVLLLAFLSLYTATAGTSLWRVTAFCLHQFRVGDDAITKDALYHQQQAILRNVETPVSAAWQLLRLAFAWRNHARAPFARSAILAALAFLFAAGIVAAVVLTSKVALGGSTSIGYCKFSMLGISIIFAFGTLLILLGFFVDTCTGSVQMYLNRGRSSRLTWALDEKLQLQRMAYEGRGWGPFANGTKSIPLTEKDVELGPYDFENPIHPTISEGTPQPISGFWIDRRPHSPDILPSTMDCVSEKANHVYAHRKARDRAFAWTAPSNVDGRETRGSSIIVGGLGGARNLRIVNGGLDGTRCSSSSIITFGTRRHSIASTGIAGANRSLVSLASNVSCKDWKQPHVCGATMSAASQRLDVGGPAGFPANPSLVSVTNNASSSAGLPRVSEDNASIVSVASTLTSSANARKSQLATPANARTTSGTSLSREHRPELKDLLQTDAGTAMVQRQLHIPTLPTPPAPALCPHHQGQATAKPHRQSPLQYEHQVDDAGVEYEHRAEMYGSREHRELDAVRVSSKEGR